MQMTGKRFGQVTLGMLVALLAWDHSGWDMRLAAAVGGAEGFALRHDWLLTRLLHDGGRVLSWGFAMLLCLMVAWPRGVFRRLPFARRVQLASAPLLAAGLVVGLKSFGHASCPWDMAAFGGVARQLPHWRAWLDGDGGAGRCFPAGHAVAGFAFLAGGFAWREHAPRVARVWFAGALCAGLLFGIAQQLRGAHFMSAMLWSAWICWLVGGLVDSIVVRWPQPQPQPQAAP